MVCTKCPVGLEIILDAPDSTPNDEAQVEARFGLSDIVLILTQDWCTVCVKCTIGLEIILDAPNGTPR